MHRKFRSLIVPTVRTMLGIFFSVSGGLKIIDLRNFIADIELYGIVTGLYAVMAAFVVIFIEIAAGIFWVSSRFIEESGAALIALLLLFNFAMSYNLIIGNVFDCGCFGALMKSPISYWSILRNFFLIFTMYAVMKKRSSTEAE